MDNNSIESTLGVNASKRPHLGESIKNGVTQMSDAIFSDNRD
ncbi:hypothetical protein FBR4_2300 [Lactiplantibacillus plantarum]|nr:Hypothetical protein zj316_2015 [Lactiplantibacillus plantarum ZJ316]ASL80138.1 hypothetical protein GBLP1_g1654 [Lactiplantibacillus plantarum]KZD94032.1 hypothetical protein FBR4_2300 [Lactiplantibacillus plantarum]KZT97404.1 hypothetical protein Nizo2257_1477 [Lactiplantibacillus plantarum]KZU01690.1 hypothetical protein Nizo2258_0019 [Lactiplantibacillus plantarum]